MKFFRLTKEAFQKNKDAAPEINYEMFSHGKYVLMKQGNGTAHVFYVSDQDKSANTTTIEEFEMEVVPETAEEVSREYFLKRVG